MKSGDKRTVWIPVIVGFILFVIAGVCAVENFRETRQGR